MIIRILQRKRVLLLLSLLFAMGWTEAQTNPRGNIGSLNGVFSVSDNTQICFSKGNLQYKASTDTWRFAENQWDYVGGMDEYAEIDYGNVYENGVKSDNNLKSSTYDGWVDLFGWGTSGYDHGAVCYQPWEVEEDYYEGDSWVDFKYYAYGGMTYDLNNQTGKADWGYNAISNGGNEENLWRTLSKDEWVYLINERNTPSGIRFAHAIVNDVAGLILLPDDWNSSIYALNDVNNDSPEASDDANILTVSQWNLLEENGAVFLPRNGFMELDYYSYQEEFNYWASTHYDEINAYSFVYNEYIFQANCSYLRHVGMGVRLVKTASSETSFFIKATPNSSDYGRVDGTGSYTLGETCTLVATPNEGYSLWCWVENGNEVSTSDNYSFIVSGSRNLTAVFRYTSRISFMDPITENICVQNWDTDSDGFLSYEEASAVTDLGGAFQGNEDITSFDELQFFTGLTSLVNEGNLGSGTFYGCSNLNSIVIPNAVTTIGDYSFSDCANLTSINIPYAVETIGEGAFSFCTSLESLNLPNSVTNIGAFAFQGCENLSEVTLSEALTTIEESMFDGCTNLTSVSIPGLVSVIGAYSFSWCSSLSSVSIPATVASIGEAGFSSIPGEDSQVQQR